MAIGKTNSVINGGFNRSTIVVNIDSGSNVILENNNKVLSTFERDGEWAFNKCEPGLYMATATKDNKVDTTSFVVSENKNQPMMYRVNMSYFMAHIAVTYPAGSICKCVQNNKILEAPDTSGFFVFNVKFSGDWTVSCTDGKDFSEMIISITENGQNESCELSYQLYASDFDWISFGTLDQDYQIVYDDDTTIPQNLWPTAKNWKARLLTSNTLIPLKDGSIDAFVVGGGGGAGATQYGYDQYGKYYYYITGRGGSGGRTVQIDSLLINKNQPYAIAIGAGGNGGRNGGGGGGVTNINGGGAVDGSSADITLEFGIGPKKYGIAGVTKGGVAGEKNTGDGGDGRDSAWNAGWNAGTNGGSGIVIIRNARGV